MPRFATIARSVLIVPFAVGLAACPGGHGGPDPVPTFSVNLIVPSQGSTFESTAVRITGSGFKAGVKVTADGVDLPITLVGNSQITTTLPARAPGHIDIVVTSSDHETASVPGGFTYVAPSPITIASLDPDNVALTGGGFVINGSGFLPGVIVTVDNSPMDVFVVGTSKIVVNVRPHALGVVDVGVTNPFTERVVLRNAFTFTPPPPITVQQAVPSQGSTEGGTLLAIYGLSIEPNATVRIDGQLVPGEFGDGAMNVDMPAHAPGPVDILVTNPNGQSAGLSAAFTYVLPSTFSFTGRWDTYVRPSWNGGPGFRIENDKITLLFCGFETINLVPDTPPTVVDGAFSFNARGGGQFAGHIVANGEAAGTTSIPGCGSGKWYGYRR